MSFVLEFAAVGAEDLPRVGGKGANLGEMSRAGFPVPPGFCVTTAAYRVFLDPSALDVLDGVPADLEAVRAAGAVVRERLAERPIPPEVAEAVVEAWEALGPERAYAVRSSATAEDLPDASFAGQQDTILNVIGRDPILDAVRRCWISLFTDRAILYRLEHGFPHHQVELAAVVQRMVLPDVAGILFTVDPISGHRHRVSIDAGFGLGEALVSGKVSADLFHVDQRTGKLVSKRIADKRLRIRPVAGGGTVEEPLPEELRNVPSLDDGTAERLAALGMRVAAHYGRPQDIEWCLEGGELFLVQARPVTTLLPPAEPRPADERLHVYVCWNHIQGMVDPMPTLARSLVRLVNPFGKGGAVSERTPYMVDAGGWLYHDATDLLLFGPVAKRLPKALENSDELMGRALAEVVARPEFKAARSWRHSLSMAASLAGWLVPIALGAVRWGLWSRPEGVVDRIAAELDQRVAAWRDRIAAAEPGRARLEVAREAMGSVFGEVRHVIPVIFGAFLANDLARWLTARPDQVALLLRAMPGNAVTEKDLEAADLTELVRGDPLQEQLVRTTAPADLKDAASGPLRDAWVRWLDRWGARGPAEVDASRPRYNEDPTPVVHAIRAALDGPPRAARDGFERMAAEADHAREGLIAGAPFWARGVVARCTRAGRALLAAREQPKLHGVRVLALVRQVVLEEGERLRAAGALESAADVWHLTMDEIVAGDIDQKRIEERKALLRRARGITAPRVLTSDGESVVARHAVGDAPAGALVGTSASPGVVEGTARVVLDPNTAVLAPGEILIAPYTDPGWTPLFAKAGGLVMEVGGQMTHGSVVAREYGIPAVVCVDGATRKISDGQRVVVDGDRGWVLPAADQP